MTNMSLWSVPGPACPAAINLSYDVYCRDGPKPSVANWTRRQSKRAKTVWKKYKTAQWRENPATVQQ